MRGTIQEPSRPGIRIMRSTVFANLTSQSFTLLLSPLHFEQEQHRAPGHILVVLSNSTRVLPWLVTTPFGSLPRSLPRCNLHSHLQGVLEKPLATPLWRKIAVMVAVMVLWLHEFLS
jgi:hypothetical protein